ncbi:beta-lactamase domain protein [mine drainage metagenome]|uniref:Beta-lactamase domain protein n=1 Tax=mine drainage metagenome TaxID=410659 RepID=T1AC56_9ZZZZ
MSRPEVRELGEGRRLLDLDFRDTEGLVAAYLLPEEEGWTLVETGPTTCRSALLAGLAEAGVAPAEVRHVFVTHVHLDHAGGVGALADALPRATFYAHESGVPHLVDPSRLIASARRAWGAAADPLWGPIVPAPAPRVVALRGGERFPLRGGDLEVIATPGHARHHLAFFDGRLRAMFTGDGAGVRLERTAHLRPAIPPPDLDLDRLFASVEEMRRREPRLVLFSHFGPSPDGAADLARYRGIVEAWRDVALDAARERAEIGFIAGRLREYDHRILAAERARVAEADRALLVSGYELAAAGLLRYFETHGQIAAP